MILIISDNDDQSTNDVIDWLIFKGKDFCRINRTDVFELEHVEFNGKKSDFVINTLDKKNSLNFKNLSSYWYRRGYLNIKFTGIRQSSSKLDDNNFFYNALNNYLNKEHQIVVDCLLGLIYSLNGFGKFHENDTNKVINLIAAESVGLKIPDTIISKEKEILLDFFILYI